jgi:DNA repair protein RecO (recombination protein O)
MAAEQALALVVRGTDWSETSRITTLFTREFGKVRALAKGGRRLKSNFDCAFDLLSVCRIVFLRKAHGGLDLLTEARLEEQFRVLRENLTALYAGYYVAELLADGTQDYDPHPELFDAALGTLRELGKQEPLPPAPSPEGRGGEMQPPPSFTGKGVGALGSSVLDAVTGFELVWLRELGYSPRLDACAACGAELLSGGAVRAVFSPASGGALCPACGPAAPDRRWLTREGLAALRELTAAAESDNPLPPRLSHGVRGELRPVLGQTVSFVLGRRPRLLGYLDTR